MIPCLRRHRVRSTFTSDETRFASYLYDSSRRDKTRIMLRGINYYELAGRNHRDSIVVKQQLETEHAAAATTFRRNENNRRGDPSILSFH